MAECDRLFDELFDRFCDDTRRPPPETCDRGSNVLDFNNADPQEPVVDYQDLIKNGPPPGGNRSDLFQSVIFHLAAQGRSEEEIANELAQYPNGIAAKYAGRLPVEVQRSFGKFQARRQAAATGGGGKGGGGGGGPSAGASAGAGASPPIAPVASLWPTIYIKQGEIPRVLNEAEDALLQHDAEIYQYGGLLVQPQLQLIKCSGGREFLSWQLPEVTVMNMVVLLACAARFMRHDKRSNAWTQVDVPEKIAKAYLDCKNRRVPRVVGIANAPFLRADGTICDREGYDAATGVLCKWDGQVFPPVPLNPTRGAALKALAVLEEPLAEFPFVAAADKSAALSAILTALDRKGMDVAPVHGFTAPVAGTGKGLLGDIAAVIATGRPAPWGNQGPDEREQEKRLGSALIDGDSLIGLDNCERPLEGATFNSLVTQHIIQVRVLGKSQKVNCPNSALIFANGNNLIVGADMTRRVVLSGLDAKVERPETRKFKDNHLLDTVCANRVLLVLAGLTVLRAWHVARASANINLDPLDFVKWSERVRKPLVWLGRADPGDTMEKAREDDPYRLERSTVFLESDRVLG
jgi:hypothetical protein